MKATIINVIEDYPFISVYYASGVFREYKTFWDVPETVKTFMQNANKVYRDQFGCKVWSMQD